MSEQWAKDKRRKTEVQTFVSSNSKYIFFRWTLECSPSTACRELSRNKTKIEKYSPKVAQEISEERKKSFKNEVIVNTPMVLYGNTYKKNTDFKDFTDKEVNGYQDRINNRPRKVLDFEKPKDLFYQKVIWKIALDSGMDALCLI